LLGQQLGVNPSDAQRLRDGLGGRLAVSCQQDNVADAEPGQLLEDRGGIGPQAISGADGSQDDSIPGHEQAGLTARVELV
jgi:hypothetical protein